MRKNRNKCNDTFYQAPAGTKGVGILNANASKYGRLDEAEGEQPYYWYQSIGNITGKAPEPFVGFPFALTVGNFFNSIYGYSTEYGIGDLVPDIVDGVTIPELQIQGHPNQVRIQLHTENDLPIEGVELLEFICDDLGEVYNMAWSEVSSFYNADIFDSDPDFDKYTAFADYIKSKEGEVVTLTFKNIT